MNTFHAPIIVQVDLEMPFTLSVNTVLYIIPVLNCVILDQHQRYSCFISLPIRSGLSISSSSLSTAKAKSLTSRLWPKLQTNVMA